MIFQYNLRYNEYNIKKQRGVFGEKICFILICVTAISICPILCLSQATDTTIIEMQIGNPVMRVNKQKLNIDEYGTLPATSKGRTLIPVRAVIEAIGGTL